VPSPDSVAVVPVKEWKVLGTSVPRPNAPELVTGVHEYPSDIKRPDMWYAKVLRAAGIGAKLISVSLPKNSTELVVVRDDQFVGVAAPSSFAAADRNQRDRSFG
jgi:hypothetical protein